MTDANKSSHRPFVIALLAALGVVAVATPARADTIVLKDDTRLEGTVVDQKEGQYVVVASADGGRETIPWSEVKRVILAPGSKGATTDGAAVTPAATATTTAPTAAATPGTTADTTPVATTSDADAPRTTFFSMGSGIGTGGYSGSQGSKGTSIEGSGMILVSSLQGGFFVSHNFAIGAGGSFIYMPSPSGTRDGKSVDAKIDAAPGGFIGPAIRFYASDGVFLACVLGYGGMGTSGVFGGTGPAVAPSLGFDVYRRNHFRIGVEAHAYWLSLSSGDKESGTFLGGGALLSLSYL